LAVKMTLIGCTLGVAGAGGEDDYQIPETAGDPGVAMEYAELAP
jgi:hypothetical protein